jgi:predicted molibdopterin-dependent oxidoreductase YjgC
LIARDGGLVETDWDQALAEAAAALAEFKQTHGGAAFGAILSPHLTNEENYCFGVLLATLGVKRVAMPVPLGKSDDLLIKAEKAANARGVRELGLVHGGDDGLAALLKSIENGEVRGLYICGGDPTTAGPPPALAPLLPKLELLIVQDLKLYPAYAGARVVFPTTTFAEKDGTFTNHSGRVQRINKVLELPPGWINDGGIFTTLVNRLEGREDKFALPLIWEAMEREGSAFANLDLSAVGPHGAALESRS